MSPPEFLPQRREDAKKFANTLRLRALAVKMKMAHKGSKYQKFIRQNKGDQSGIIHLCQFSLIKTLAIMKKRFLAALVLLASLNTLSAQLVDYRWDTHGVGFGVPRDFSVKANSAEEFTAENGNIFLTILPFQDENVTKDNLAEAVVEMAVNMEYDSVEAADEADVDDFTGYYVKGTKEGVNALVMGLLDRKSSTNLLVIVAYMDGYESQALDIANSFYAFD